MTAASNQRATPLCSRSAPVRAFCEGGQALRSKSGSREQRLLSFYVRPPITSPEHRSDSLRISFRGLEDVAGRPLVARGVRSRRGAVFFVLRGFASGAVREGEEGAEVSQGRARGGCGSTMRFSLLPWPF